MNEAAFSTSRAHFQITTVVVEVVLTQLRKVPSSNKSICANDDDTFFHPCQQSRLLGKKSPLLFPRAFSHQSEWKTENAKWNEALRASRGNSLWNEMKKEVRKTPSYPIGASQARLRLNFPTSISVAPEKARGSHVAHATIY